MSRLIRPLRRGIPILQTTSHAIITTTTPPIPSTVRPYSSFLQTGPAPPRLPPDQQAEFERLQRAAEAALSSHTTIPAAPEQQQQQPPLSTSRHVSTPSPQPAAAATATATATSQPETLDAAAVGGTFSGGIRKGAPPEFEGDRNPVTGEVGGPKNEPLRWGSAGDWSFNGRVTDF
ncbi:hypothetical protein C7999DRAFT_33888 [Corynascus novoguineensis]|uniref:Succinate dehydrogenase assembly factor 4, mitochondrial n=1 Tax=Corynascus novoguineensis TaxID=1126955 RepID=A0AAN7CPA2_9PEZI|nr:hypothetical protein C7999DRAFT_33888 [Corynascus novoguineensis]